MTTEFGNKEVLGDFDKCSLSGMMEIVPARVVGGKHMMRSRDSNPDFIFQELVPLKGLRSDGIVIGECGSREWLMFGKVSDATVAKGMMTSREGSGALKRRGNCRPQRFEMA